MRQVVSVCALVALITALIPPAPATATDLAVGHCDASYNAAPYSTYVAGRMCDTNDQTQFIIDSSGNVGCGAKVDLGSAETVHSVRVVVGTSSGYTVPIVFAHAGNFDSTCAGTNMTQQIGTGAWTGDTSSTCDGNPCHIYTYTFSSDVSLRYWSVRYNGGANGFQLFSFELTEGTPPTDFADYVYGLRLDHPAFQRVITWWWKQTWSGTAEVTNGASEELFIDDGGVENAKVVVTILCPVACGDDVYTIHVTPDGMSEATYELDSDVDGQVIASPSRPVVTDMFACFNVTTDQCAAPYDDDAGYGVVRWQYACSDGAPGPSGTCDPTVILLGRSKFSGSCSFEESFEVSQPKYAGVVYATRFNLGFDEDAGVLGLYVSNVVNGDLHSCRTFAINYATGGVIGGVTVPPPGGSGGSTGDEGCDSNPVVCGLGDVVKGVLVALFVPCGMGPRATDDCDEVVTFEGLRAVLESREPFASIIAAYTALGDVVNTDADITDGEYCDDFVLATFELPDPEGWKWPEGDTSRTVINRQYTEQNWSVPLCLETIGGTTEYQELFRPLMGGFVYLTFLFNMVKHYSPKPRLNA